MLRKQINTNVASVTCDVCGRSLLRGEQSTVFLASGSRRNVCDLCTVRAAHEGWIREGVDDPRISAQDERRRGPLRGLMRARRPDLRLEPGGAEALLAGSGPEPPESPAGTAIPSVRHEEPADSGESLYDGRSVRGIPSNAELKVARAIELFNASPQVRKVAGINRSLGVPIVSARPSLTEGSVVTIVVGWELSWYRFEVDLGDEASGVRIVGQGTELGELEPAERTPNGSAAADGTLSYARPTTETED